MQIYLTSRGYDGSQVQRILISSICIFLCTWYIARKKMQRWICCYLSMSTFEFSIILYLSPKAHHLGYMLQLPRVAVICVRFFNNICIIFNCLQMIVRIACCYHPQEAFVLQRLPVSSDLVWCILCLCLVWVIAVPRPFGNIC